MIEVFFRYRVHPAQALAFEHAYGQHGPWVALFKRHPGFIRTRLFQQKADTHVYLTIDVWKSKEDYDQFRSECADEYLRLDTQLGMLKLEEHLLGYFEGDDEYRAPRDTLA
jgi:heme-degrading monooxygenase HmoA